MAPRKSAAAAGPPAAGAAVVTGPSAPPPPIAPGAASSDRPVLPADIPQFFVPQRQAPRAGGRLVYAPMAIGIATVVFALPKIGVNHTRATTRLADVDARLGTVEWAAGEDVDIAPRDLRSEPESEAAFAAVPPAASKPKTYEAWERSLKAWLGQSSQLDLLQSAQTGVVSLPGESERDFRVRLQTRTREQRDEALSKLREKYAAKLVVLDEKIRRAEQAVERESGQATQQKLQTGLSIGATVLGALFGRKKVSVSTLGRATTAARGMGRTMKEQQDIGRARDTLAAARQQKADVEARIQAEVDALGAALDPLTELLLPLPVKPKRSDVTVQAVGLAWVPCWEDDRGARTRA